MKHLGQYKHLPLEERAFKHLKDENLSNTEIQLLKCVYLNATKYHTLPDELIPFQKMANELVEEKIQNAPKWKRDYGNYLVSPFIVFNECLIPALIGKEYIDEWNNGKYPLALLFKK